MAPSRAAVRASTAVILVLGLLAPQSASARSHKRGHPSGAWVALYRLDGKGSQRTQWTLDHEPTEVCDERAVGSGSEQDDFTLAPGGLSFVTGVGERALSIVPQQASLRLTVTTQRSGSVTSGPEPPEGCGIADGEASGELPQPDCGVRQGQLLGELTPGGGATLQLRAAEEADFTVTPIDEGHEPSVPYTDCVNLGTLLPELISTDVRFSTSVPAMPPQIGPEQLLGTGASTVPLTESADVTGTTTASYELTLSKQVALSEVLASASQVKIGKSGKGSVSLRCKAVSRSCGGSAFVALDVGYATAATAGGASARAASFGELPAPRSFPAPASRQMRSFGATRFKIHAKHAKRVTLALAHFTPARLKSLKGLPLYVGVTLRSGRAKLSYLVARAKLR